MAEQPKITAFASDQKTASGVPRRPSSPGCCFTADLKKRPQTYEARDLVLSADPDVLTLDIIMPKLDGLSFLKKLQQYFPKPVVIVSTIAKDSSRVAENAINYGAAEVIDKDTLELYKGMDVVRDILIPKLRSASRKIPSKTLA